MPRMLPAAQRPLRFAVRSARRAGRPVPSVPLALPVLLTAATLLAAVPAARAQGKDLPVLSHPLGSKSSPASAATPAAAPADAAPKPKAPAAGFRDITWDELVPKDWDPFKDFKSMNLAGLSDADPRAAAALKQLREAWDRAPTNPQIEGQSVRLPGYLVPLEDSKAGMSEFLLVPYFGACIHTPPPPANQVVHVKPKKPPKGLRSMDAVWITGTLKPGRIDTLMGTSGYRMEAVKVEPYTGK